MPTKDVPLVFPNLSSCLERFASAYTTEYRGPRQMQKHIVLQTHAAEASEAHYREKTGCAKARWTPRSYCHRRSSCDIANSHAIRAEARFWDYVRVGLFTTAIIFLLEFLHVEVDTNLWANVAERLQATRKTRTEREETAI